MPETNIKVVIDTNLWVSMAMGSRLVSVQLLTVIENPLIEVFTSTELLDELTETLAKPRLRQYLNHERTSKLFDLIWLKTKLTTVKSTLKICRDPKDDFIINLAIDAQAQYIITGDNDLLTLSPIGMIEVLRISDFLEKLV